MIDMKRHIIQLSVIMAAVLSLSSCDFLKENPKTFLSPENYYQTEDQIKVAVNGLYGSANQYWGADNLITFVYSSSLTSPLLFTEFLAGNSESMRIQGQGSGLQLPILEDNGHAETIWANHYASIENCNSVIAGLESLKIEINFDNLSFYLAQAYFLRAYYYYTLVRWFGEIPLKTTPTTGLADSKMQKSSVADVYKQIVDDLKYAETLIESRDWNTTDGRVTKGAVKSLLAKVYLSMAGYPLLDNSAYGLAYEKASEVVNNGGFSLFDNYAEMRDPANHNTKEYIFSLQRSKNGSYPNPYHSWTLPYEQSAYVSSVPDGGFLVPTKLFYDSFSDADLRKAEGGYFYTHYPAYDGSGEIEFTRPFIFKWFDINALDGSYSGRNFPLIRYAEVLLVLAEAKAMMDGGSTTDASAVDAWYAVHHRAVPSDPKPESVSQDMVLEEKTKEFCFEGITWYDIVRTHRIFDPASKTMKNAVGFQTSNHNRAFIESDFTFPYPIREVRLNPNLKD